MTIRRAGASYWSYNRPLVNLSVLHARGPWLSPRVTVRPRSTSQRPFSFAFDIDGVLLKGSKPIPGAIEALKLLRRHQIPFILLTNGGGLLEETRTRNLSKYLGIEISTDQFIQSHTPFRLHPKQHAFKNVLVCGGILDNCRKVARSYGFPHVTIPFDILATDPAIWPYHTLSVEERNSTLPLSKDPIDAIYVYHDPRDWGLDSQIIIDLLLSKGGVIGTQQDGHGKEQALPLYFSNPDLLWANAYPHSRFGQGAFQILIEGLFHAVTGRRLESTTIGKPSNLTYAYAARVLADYHERRTAGPYNTAGSQAAQVYMVGDNKLSDIQGANDFGWSSILVKTGVFKGTTAEGTSGDIPATFCVEDVGTAVEMVMSREGVI